MSWLIDIKLNGQLGLCRMEFKDNGGRDLAWPILVTCALESSARVMWWDVLGEDKCDKRKRLPAIWSEASE